MVVIDKAIPYLDKIVLKIKDQLINKATNPITKMLAQKTAQKLLEEAQKKVNDLNAKADTQAKQLIQKAADNAKLQ